MSSSERTVLIWRVGSAKILKINERACTLFKDLRVNYKKCIILHNYIMFFNIFFFQFFRNTLPLSIVEIISHITMIQNIGMEVLQIKQITTQLIGKKNSVCIFTKFLLHPHKNLWNWNNKRAKKYFPDFKYFIFFL